MSNLNNNYLKTLRIFIASPHDLNEERKRFPEAINEINQIKAAQMGAHLEPLGWETPLLMMRGGVLL